MLPLLFSAGVDREEATAIGGGGLRAEVQSLEGDLDTGERVGLTRRGTTGVERVVEW